MFAFYGAHGSFFSSVCVWAAAPRDSKEPKLPEQNRLDRPAPSSVWVVIVRQISPGPCRKMATPGPNPNDNPRAHSYDPHDKDTSLISYNHHAYTLKSIRHLRDHAAFLPANRRPGFHCLLHVEGHAKARHTNCLRARIRTEGCSLSLPLLTHEVLYVSYQSY